MTEREIAEVLRAVPERCLRCDMLTSGPATSLCQDGELHRWNPDYPAMARAVVEQVVRPLMSKKIGPDWREALPYESELELAAALADRDARLARLVEALKEIMELYDPVANGWPYDMSKYAEKARAALADAGAGKEAE